MADDGDGVAMDDVGLGKVAGVVAAVVTDAVWVRGA